jgi:hypothetical protein
MGAYKKVVAVERQNRLLTVLMIVLLGMLAVVMIQKNDKEEAPADPDAIPTRDLFDYENKDIVSLTLKSASGTLIFTKDGESWKQTAPAERPVETRKVEEIIERFNTVKIEERSLSGAAADYGLDDAKGVEVTLSKQDGTSFSLTVGSDSSVGYKSYVKSDEKITLVSTRLSELVHRKADDFRNKTVWTISSYSAKRIKLVQGTNEPIILVKENGGWRLGEGGPRADKETIDDWLGNASALKAVEFLEGQDDASLGLLAPSATITIEDSEGTHTMQVGAREDDGMVVRVGSNPAVRVGAEALVLLEESNWLSKKLVGASRYLIDGMELQFGERSFRFTRQEGAWANASGKPANLDPFLEQLEAFSADRSQSGLPALSESWGKISLSLGEGETELIQLGQLVGEMRLARDAGGGPVFQIKQADLDSLISSLP